MRFLLSGLLMLLSFAETIPSWSRSDLPMNAAIQMGLLSVPASAVWWGKGRVRSVGYLVLLAAVVVPLVPIRW